MLIIALVLAVIGLAALVTAVVTSNALIAWVCIGASVVGVVLLIVDAVRDRSRRDDGDAPAEHAAESEHFDAEYPDDPDTLAETGSGAETEADPDEEPYVEPDTDPDADTRAVPLDEQHEDEPATGERNTP
jgi:hypothetical protein